MVAPNTGPIVVIRSTTLLAHKQKSYSMDCYFRQEWKDSRLAFDPESFQGKPNGLPLSVSMLDKIWKPDTFFYNGKKSYIHTITNPNKLLRIANDGMVLYSSRSVLAVSPPSPASFYSLTVCLRITHALE